MLYFSQGILGAVCIFFSCIHLLPQKLSKKGLFVLFSWTFCSTCMFSLLMGQYFAFITVFGALTIIYLFSSLKWLSLCCALFGYLFSVTLNYLCIWMAQRIWNVEFQQINHTASMILPFSVIFCFICYIATFLLGYLLNKKLKIVSILSENNSCKIIFSALIILSVVFIFNFSYGENIGYSYGVMAFNGILFLAVFLTVAALLLSLYYSILHEEQAKSRLKQYEKLQDYTQELERLYGSMRSFKHDYINILSTMSGYIENGDMEKLKEYFCREILPVSHGFSESDTKLGTLAQIKCIELKSLLSSKLIYASELGLHIELELPDPIESCPMPPVDLSRVMGIFLDNAIEAALNTDEKEIRLCMMREPESLVIILKNASLPLPLGTLSRPWGSDKGEDRGIGLYNAKNILGRYSHVVWDTEYHAPWFTQILKIYYEKEPL